MTSRIADWYDRLVLGQPLLVLILLSLSLSFFAYHAKDFKLDASADSLLLEDDKDLRIFREVQARYATQEFLVVTYSPKGDLFSNESLNELRGLRDALRGLERADSVISMLDVPLVNSADLSFTEMARNVPTLEKGNVDIARARLELTTSPIYRNLVMSPDGRITALQINLKNDPRYAELLAKKTAAVKQAKDKADPESERALVEARDEYAAYTARLDRQRHEDIVWIRAQLEPYKRNAEIHLGGVPMVADDMITFIRNDLEVFGLGVLVFLIVTLSVIFRRLQWVVLPLLSCFYAVLTMVGVLGFLDWRVTVISSNFISLMLIITMSMNVHLIVRYRQLSRDYPDWSQRERVFTTTRKLVWPALYTALTTIIAFASLVFSGIKPVIDFGWMMTIGLSVTFLTSFLLFPVVLGLLKPTDESTRDSESVPFTGILANITERHGGKVLIAALVLAVLGGIGVSRLTVENSFINYFDKDTEIYQGMRLIDEHLGGTTPLDVVLSVKEEVAPPPEDDFFSFDNLSNMIPGLGGGSDKESTWFTPYKIDRIKAVHDYLDGLPEVGKVLSLASLIRVAEQLNDGKELDSLALALIYRKIPDQLRTSMINPYISIDNDEARINLRVKDSLPDLHRKELLERIHRDLGERLKLGDDQFQVTGMLVLYNNMLQSLFNSQIKTLGVVMLGIALMLLVLFRSVRLAVIGIVPNLLAAGLILGLLGWLNIPLDMMTITIAAITIGIAVDNSIHYIYRFREERPRMESDIATMHYCHANIGKAVQYTSFTIIAGFSILVLSNFIPTIYFGLFTALAMFIALLAVLTLLPKLLLMFRPIRVSGNQAGPSPGD